MLFFIAVSLDSQSTDCRVDVVYSFVDATRIANGVVAVTAVGVLFGDFGQRRRAVICFGVHDVQVFTELTQRLREHVGSTDQLIDGLKELRIAAVTRQRQQWQRF